MKDKILAFIAKTKTAFSNRRSHMQGSKVHKPFIDEIAADESELELATGIIDALDESKKTFAASVLFYLMENVVPIFRKWMMRIGKIADIHTAGHSKAKEDFGELTNGIHSLLLEVNISDGQQLITVEPQEEKPGRAIVKRYEKEKYLQTHEIQIVNSHKIETSSQTAKALS